MTRGKLVNDSGLWERAAVLAGLALLVVLAWAYTVYWAGALATAPAEMTTGMRMGGMVMPALHVWGPADFGLALAMWAVMMVAMMTPSAVPMVLTYHKLVRGWGSVGTTALFFAGYLLVWTAFSAAATAAQGLLQGTGALSPMLTTASPLFGGLVLIAAGAFQLTPLKQACLTQCRTPLGFFMTEWREGRRGAFIMGVRHGAFCTGCCWLLMAVLFVVGLMNLFWIAVLSAYVLLEKMLPGGRKLSWIAGAALMGWGAWLVLGALR